MAVTSTAMTMEAFSIDVREATVIELSSRPFESTLRRKTKMAGNHGMAHAAVGRGSAPAANGIRRIVLASLVGTTIEFYDSTFTAPPPRW
jgi:hypothetical protein